tara:strand:+ start:90 stop:686 length:597 start_codon:yes stop_codon:yes gene_type:complete
MKQLFLIVLSVLIFSFCSTNQEQSSKNEDIFNYNKFEEKYNITLLDEEVNEMGVIKAQIAQRVYFGKSDSSLSKDEIELYLNQRLKKLDDRKGFKNFSNASHVIIWLHPSNDHAAEGGANWIAMISKFGEENNVQFSINEDKLDYLKSPTNDIINNIISRTFKIIQFIFIDTKLNIIFFSKFTNHSYPICSTLSSMII